VCFESQVGGFISMAAHGTGAKIPTVDDFVVEMKIVREEKRSWVLKKAIAKFGLRWTILSWK